jgi:hypothetical protein
MLHPSRCSAVNGLVAELIASTGNQRHAGLVAYLARMVRDEEVDIGSALPFLL